MQKTVLRKTTASLVRAPENDEAILHFSLQGLLPAEQTLALNTWLGTLALISYERDRPHMLMEQQFTNGELYTLLPLLEAYPYYCPFETLLARFNTTHVTEAAIASCRQRLHEALTIGEWDQEMRPIRHAISRVRLKLRAFDLRIASMSGLGYILIGANPAFST